MSATWKREGYRRLKEHRDGKTFRRYMREGRKTYPAMFDMKVRTYYALSFVSPAICVFLSRLKNSPAAPAEYNVDIRELDLER